MGEPPQAGQPVRLANDQDREVGAAGRLHPPIDGGQVTTDPAHPAGRDPQTKESQQLRVGHRAMLPRRLDQNGLKPVQIDEGTAAVGGASVGCHTITLKGSARC